MSFIWVVKNGNRNFSYQTILSKVDSLLKDCDITLVTMQFQQRTKQLPLHELRSHRKEMTLTISTKVTRAKNVPQVI